MNLQLGERVERSRGRLTHRVAASGLERSHSGPSRLRYVKAPVTRPLPWKAQSRVKVHHTEEDLNKVPRRGGARNAKEAISEIDEDVISKEALSDVGKEALSRVRILLRAQAWVLDVEDALVQVRALVVSGVDKEALSDVDKEALNKAVTINVQASRLLLRLRPSRLRPSRTREGVPRPTGICVAAMSASTLRRFRADRAS